MRPLVVRDCISLGDFKGVLQQLSSSGIATVQSFGVYYSYVDVHHMVLHKGQCFKKQKQKKKRGPHLLLY